MSGFERHGIKHLSPSSLALYRAEPALWCLQYLHGAKSNEPKSAAWRGTAVEAGLDAWLFGATPEEAEARAIENFNLNSDGLADDKTDKQRGLIPKILKSAIAAFDQWPAEHRKPMSRQIRVESWVDGVPVPIIGFVDYTWDKMLLDLKTTERRPSAPRADHQAQVAFYHKATGKTPKLLYAAPSGFAWFEVEGVDLDGAWQAIESAARAVAKLLDRSSTAKDATAIFAPRFDDFRWDAGMIKQYRQLSL